MTVGAVILSDSLEEALADAEGRVAIRRMVDSAWAGGALPIIVVTPDEGGRVAAALDGSPAVLVDPGATRRLAAWRIGIDAALAAVGETSALLLWPGRMIWVDPESVTSLIEAHGRQSGTVFRPRRTGEVGWPALVPAGIIGGSLDGGAATLESALAGTGTTAVELGDPGTVLGNEIRLEDLPAYMGPPGPVGGPPPEWGAAAAETPDPEVPRPA